MDLSQDVLREIIPVYDKVNSFISLGKDVEHRNRAIKGRVKKGINIRVFDGDALCIACEGGPTCLTRPLLRS